MLPYIAVLLSGSGARSSAPSTTGETTPNTGATSSGVSKKADVSGMAGVGGYVEYLPDNYDPGTTYPVIVWLHGQGEAGSGSDSDLDQVYNSGIMNWLKTNDVPFIVLAPQTNSGFWGGNPNTRTYEFFDYAFNPTDGVYKDVIDTDSMHLIGYSAGGFGVGLFIEEGSSYYQMLSTMTSCSGNLNDANGFAQRILDNNQYFWNHNSDTDGVVGRGASETFTKQIYDLDSSRVRFTTYTSRNHTQMQDVVYNNSGTGQTQNTGTFSSSYPYYEWAAGSWYDWLGDNSK